MQKEYLDVIEVVRHADVSIGTAGGVAARQQCVKEQTRQPVFVAHQELAYSLNQVLRSLAQNFSYSIALLVSVTNSCFLAEAARVSDHTARDVGCSSIDRNTSFSM